MNSPFFIEYLPGICTTYATLVVWCFFFFTFVLQLVVYSSFLPLPLSHFHRIASHRIASYRIVASVQCPVLLLFSYFGSFVIFIGPHWVKNVQRFGNLVEYRYMLAAWTLSGTAQHRHRHRHLASGMGGELWRSRLIKCEKAKAEQWMPAPESTLVHLDNYPWQQVEREQRTGGQRTGGERDLRVAILLLNWAVKRKTKNEGSPPAHTRTRRIWAQRLDMPIAHSMLELPCSSMEPTIIVQLASTDALFHIT